MSIPDFEAWVIFATVAEQQSFSGAAETLGLSKATVSKAVTRLEQRFAAPLFHRTSRRISLTETGAHLLPQARQLAAEAEALEEAARSEARDPTGLVRVAVPMSYGLAHLGPVVADFLSRHPGIRVELSLSDEKVDLIGGSFDLALRIARLPDSSLRSRKLRDVAVKLVASPAYLAAAGTPVTAHDLGGHSCLGYTLLPNQGQWVLDHASGERVTLRPTGPLRANNAEVMQASLRAGMGIGMVPDFICQRDLETGALVHVLPDWSPPAIALYLLSPPGRQRPKRVEVLADHIVASCALR
jgi:DNA-binding transcriptional LysR family regulator